ncbi:hypothetical protein A9K72_33480 [Mesorhizobium loti]|nr:hypothetical protein A9K72_33480 [Mesorhizobium loti]
MQSRRRSFDGGYRFFIDFAALDAKRLGLCVNSSTEMTSAFAVRNVVGQPLIQGVDPRVLIPNKLGKSELAGLAWPLAVAM